MEQKNLLFLNKLIIFNKQSFAKEIKLVIKSFPTNNTPKPRYFTGEFKQIFKESNPNTLRLRKYKRENFPIHFTRQNNPDTENQSRLQEKKNPTDQQESLIKYQQIEPSNR